MFHINIAQDRIESYMEIAFFYIASGGPKHHSTALQKGSFEGPSNDCMVRDMQYAFSPL